MPNKVDNLTPIEASALKREPSGGQNLIAMSNEKPKVSAETLVTLLGSKSGLTHNPQHEMAIYLMKHCEWNAVDLERALVKEDPNLSNLLDWVNSVNSTENADLIKQLLTIPSFVQQIRCNFVEIDLRHSVIHNEIDALVEKFSFYFAPPSKWKDLIDWLPENHSDLWFDILTKHDFLKHRELLKGSIQESKVIYLNYLTPFVDKENVLMLRKLIELGVGSEEFERRVGLSITDWCRKKNCLDLLELEEVKKSSEISSLRKALRDFYPAHPRLVKNVESRIIKFLSKYYPDDVMIGDIWLTSGLGKAPYLWHIAIECNMVGLLKYPGIFPEKGYTQEMHDAILHAAIKGHQAVVNILIKHAKKHMPDAVRFHKDELKDVKSSELVNQLLQAHLPEKNKGLWSKFSIMG